MSENAVTLKDIRDELVAIRMLMFTEINLSCMALVAIHKANPDLVDMGKAAELQSSATTIVTVMNEALQKAAGKA